MNGLKNTNIRKSVFTKDEEDFMDSMFNILDDAGVVSGRDSDTVNKATCLNLILGPQIQQRSL